MAEELRARTVEISPLPSTQSAVKGLTLRRRAMCVLPILSIPQVRIPSDSVPLFRLHFLVDEVERVDVTREVAEKGQTDVARGQKALARATNDGRDEEGRT